MKMSVERRSDPDEQTGGAERRRSDRVELVVRVDYKTVDELFSEFARNINEGGLFVETDTPPEVGSGVALQFQIPGSDEPIQVMGRVVRVDYKTIDELFSEFARNINEGGLYVETDTPPELGSPVALQFQIPGSGDPIQVMGRVVRISEGAGDEPPGMGVEFEELGAQSRELINELVRNLRVGVATE